MCNIAPLSPLLLPPRPDDGPKELTRVKLRAQRAGAPRVLPAQYGQSTSGRLLPLAGSLASLTRSSRRWFHSKRVTCQARRWETRPVARGLVWFGRISIWASLGMESATQRLPQPTAFASSGGGRRMIRQQINFRPIRRAPAEPLLCCERDQLLAGDPQE